MSIKNTVGRPSKYELNDSDIQLIKLMIDEYHKNFNTKAFVKYKNIYEYSVALHRQGDFPYNYGYDFWKREGRLGRTLIDDYNAIQQQKIWVAEGDSIDVVNVEDLLQKYGGEHKKILEENLKPLVKHLNRFTREMQNLQRKTRELESENEISKEVNRKLKEKVSELQNLLLAFFTYSGANNELTNMIDLGKSKSDVINISLKNTFNDPLLFINELKGKNTTSKDEKNNIINFQKFSEYEL